MSTVSEDVNADSQKVSAKPPFLRRVRIRGYKSISFCDVTLEPLTILVGRNASGKSNFVDALAFLRDALATDVAEAVKTHGGWQTVHSRTSTNNSIMLELEIQLPGADLALLHSWSDGLTAIRGGKFKKIHFRPEKTYLAKYHLTLKSQGHEPAYVESEHLTLFEDDRDLSCGFRYKDGTFSVGFHYDESLGVDDHYLPIMSGTSKVRYLWIAAAANNPIVSHLCEVLGQISYYSFLPDRIRNLQKPSPGWYLERDGSNLGSTIETTREIEPETVERVGRYLSAITETVSLKGVIKYGEYETVQFTVPSGDSRKPLIFDAASMSDGTLRAISALVAAFQIVLPHGSPSLVAIEEPETSLHPAAMRALVAALDEATLRTQILLTTHSPDLLDAVEIQPENIRVVEMVNGATVITPMDDASVSIVRDGLNTIGGLERDRQLELNLEDLDRQSLLAKQSSTP